MKRLLTMAILLALSMKWGMLQGQNSAQININNVSTTGNPIVREVSGRPPLMYLQKDDTTGCFATYVRPTSLSVMALKAMLLPALHKAIDFVVTDKDTVHLIGLNTQTSIYFVASFPLSTVYQHTGSIKFRYFNPELTAVGLDDNPNTYVQYTHLKRIRFYRNIVDERLFITGQKITYSLPTMGYLTTRDTQYCLLDMDAITGDTKAMTARSGREQFLDVVETYNYYVVVSKYRHTLMIPMLRLYPKTNYALGNTPYKDSVAYLDSYANNYESDIMGVHVNADTFALAHSNIWDGTVVEAFRLSGSTSSSLPTASLINRYRFSDPDIKGDIRGFGYIYSDRRFLVVPELSINDGWIFNFRYPDAPNPNNLKMVYPSVTITSLCTPPYGNKFTAAGFRNARATAIYDNTSATDHCDNVVNIQATDECEPDDFKINYQSTRIDIFYRQATLVTPTYANIPFQPICNQ